MDIHILFEDSDILLIDKPPGIVVNDAQSVKGETIQQWVKEYLHLENNQNPSSETNDFLLRHGIVHRIDKETSGLLLIVKNSESFYELQRQFKERIVKKTYYAIVHGFIEGDGVITAPIGRLPWNRERFGVIPNGKESVTGYKAIQHYPSNNDDDQFTVLECYPQTGRTHQIRVHLKYINHPIIGDYLYAGRKTSRNDRLFSGRVMLHAQKISFLHPKTHDLLEIESPIPDDMKRFINK